MTTATELHEPTAEATEASTAAARMVLVADDNRQSRELLTTLLRKLTQAQVMEVMDGGAALAAAQHHPFCLAFLDIEMPGMDGLSVLETLRADGIGTHLVVVTGHSSSNNVQRALGAGANGFVVKPYAPQRIIDVLARYVSVTGDAGLLKRP